MGQIIFFPEGKLDLLEHPIFELFILLKWVRVHLIFKVNFLTLAVDDAARL